MHDLTALLTRVEAATGPDRELDAEIDIAMFGGETIWLTANYTMEQYPASRRPNSAFVGGIANEHVPLVTASLDAALALVEEMLPGAHVYIANRSFDHDGTLDAQPSCCVWHDSLRGTVFSEGDVHVGATLPLAVLSALLAPSSQSRRWKMPALSQPKCFDCGRFFRMEPGVAWKMVYSGHPPAPDREIFKCRRCREKNGQFTPQHGIRPEYSCGIFGGDHA